jgi:hypothetical protein
MSFRLTLAIVLSLCIPTLLSAQSSRRTTGGMQSGRNTQGAAQPGVQQTDLEGKIQNAGKGGIAVVDSSNRTWRVAMSANTTKIHVTGDLTAKQLRTGLLAELTADFDDRGAISKPVESISIVTLSRDKPAGAVRVGGDERVDPSGKRPSGKAASRGMTGTYKIVGRLTVGRNGALSIQAGRTPATFTLAEDAAIKVDMSDLSLTSQGCTIKVHGMAAAARPGYIQATEITVELPSVAKDKDLDKDKESTSGLKDGKARGKKSKKAAEE